MTRAEIAAEIARLERLVKSRSRMSGYQDSIADARARIDALKNETPTDG